MSEKLLKILSVIVLGVFLNVLILQVVSKKSAISQQEKIILENFFRKLIHECDFGYTLYGDKAVSLTAYFDPVPRENVFFMRGNEILKKGWQVFKKHRGHFSLKKYIILEHRDIRHNLIFITLINKKAFLKTIEEHLDLFQQILGKNLTPEILLQKLEEPKAVLLDLINHHEGLYGILLGYGRTNALLFHRRHELNIYAEQPTFSLSTAIPSKGFASLADEIAFLTNNMNPVEKQRSILYSIALPQFMGIRENNETKSLMQKYRKIRSHINNYYLKHDFLDLTVKQFCS